MNQLFFFSCLGDNQVTELFNQLRENKRQEEKVKSQLEENDEKLETSGTELEEQREKLLELDNSIQESRARILLLEGDLKETPVRPFFINLKRFNKEQDRVQRATNKELTVLRKKEKDGLKESNGLKNSIKTSEKRIQKFERLKMTFSDKRSQIEENRSEILEQLRSELHNIGIFSISVQTNEDESE